ncbi:Galactosyltransferase family protein [Leishmania donovani]|uniref:Galactosyltransferase family protein n=1 Tax=Leishmania donovani TaxID=5661 RepID=A0A504WYA3_LEIDO|nr:Galactosyltransferase family protein [Leishmania donovani]
MREENNAPPAWAPRDTHRADPLQLLSSPQKHCGLSSAAESGQGCHSRSRGKPEVDSTREASVMVHCAISQFTTKAGSQQTPSIELTKEAARRIEFPLPFSVLVQHESAVERLTTTQRSLAASRTDSLVRLNPDQLPSWTLRVIEKDCTMCFDDVTYASAVAADAGRSTDKTGNQRQEGLSVFATTSAPLGLMGPMLFAMASVTDDVDVAAELPRWQWVTRSYAQQRRFVHASQSRSAGERPRHLIVMGIPSTDQPKRYPLRDAQHVTWRTYREVARTDNNFTGALLQLYVFAAAERDSEDTTHSTVDVAQLAPTVSEYAAATEQHLAVEGGDVNNAAPYVQRRVVLRDGWRDIPRSDDAVWKSPCAGVRTSVVTTTSRVDGTSPLATLSAQLSLPVTPAFTAAAQYQEALRHRNSLWLDFLTDRKPTTKKKMGMPISWGIPTEVGMSQKVVIWLNYAYAAFPDVPYIMKGDDDMYLKVPQYLSDLRHVRGGWAKPRNLTATIPHKGVIPPTLGIDDAEECLYRVWWIYSSQVAYGNGVGYVLDRRLIQAVLNPFDGFNALLMELLTNPYNSSLNKEYVSLSMQYEDMLIGRQITDYPEAVEEFCPKKRLCYMSDQRFRAHQILRPKPTKLTWISVMAHFGMPAIPYYVHYFHKNEFKVAEEAKRLIAQGIDANAIEANATQRMHEWVASQVPSTLVGLGASLDLDWVRGDPRTTYTVAEEDEVAVYDVPYKLRRRNNIACVLESGKR